MSDGTDHGQEPGKTPKQQSMLYEVCSWCAGTGTVTSVGTPCLCVSRRVVAIGVYVSQLEHLVNINALRLEAGITAAMLRDGRAAGLVQKNERLTAVLHKNRCHPDYSYFVAPKFVGTFLDHTLPAAGYEMNPEAETAPGDVCWRRRIA